MTDADTRLRSHLLDVPRTGKDAFHAIVHEVNLSAAAQFLLQRGSNEVVVEVGHYGVNGKAVLWRGLNDAKVPKAQQGHVQGAWNGRGRHGQRIHVLPQLLEPFFVPNAEALLLVNNHQAQIVEFDIRGEQAVGADDDVRAPVGKVFERLLNFLGAAEATYQIDAHREGSEATLKGLKVLEAQDSSGSEHGNLLAVAQSFEGSAHGHFRFAVANVATKQTIHGQFTFHIALDL